MRRAKPKRKYVNFYQIVFFCSILIEGLLLSLFDWSLFRSHFLCPIKTKQNKIPQMSKCFKQLYYFSTVFITFQVVSVTFKLFSYFSNYFWYFWNFSATFRIVAVSFQIVFDFFLFLLFSGCFTYFLNWLITFQVSLTFQSSTIFEWFSYFSITSEIVAVIFQLCFFKYTNNFSYFSIVFSYI